MKLVREVLTKIHLEDIPACDAVQRGLRSALWQPGVLSRHERTVQLFHRYLLQRLTAA